MPFFQWHWMHSTLPFCKVPFPPHVMRAPASWQSNTTATCTIVHMYDFCAVQTCLLRGVIMKSNIITQLYVYHVLYCILSYSSTLPFELHFCLRGRPCVRNCCRKGGKGHSNHSSCLTKMSIALMTRKNYFPILIFQD